jgi:hypothetical protein
MVKLLTWNNLGRLMLFQGRAATYLGMLGYFQSVLTFLQVYNWNWQSIAITIFGLVMVVIITYIDFLKIWPEMNRISFEMNPEWMKTKQELKK